MYLDTSYLLIILPALALSLIAQVWVKSAFSKYSKIASRRGISGAEAARVILRANGVNNVQIEGIRGSLSDNYNPSTRVLSLSEPVFDKTSISAIGVAAHEAGHALQHARGYGPLGLRSALVPVAGIGSRFGPYVAIAGVLMGMPALVDVGIILFAAAVVFYVITLPVEFNASGRAVEALRANAILTEDELTGVKRVLSAAAMTYVASTLSAMANLLRLILLRGRRR